MTSRNHVRERQISVRPFFIAVKKKKQPPSLKKTGQLSKKNNSSEGGEGSIWDFTPQIYSGSFFGTLYCSCVIFSFLSGIEIRRWLDENRVWLFHSQWISGFVGGNAQQLSVCLTRKSMLASDKSLVCGSAWVLSGARRPGMADWVDCFSWVMFTNAPWIPLFSARLYRGQS